MGAGGGAEARISLLKEWFIAHTCTQLAAKSTHFQRAESGGYQHLGEGGLEGRKLKAQGHTASWWWICIRGQ